jgi:putative tryptophan/tyrosine transport system substrate-binding protein
VIGVLYGVSAAERAEHMAAFRRGLTETGFVEGRNVAIEYRWAEGHYDRMAWMAVDLVGRRIAVMLIGGNTTAVRATIGATQSIPIVFTTGVDPVAAGLVASLNHPSGNATGLTNFSSDLGPKKLELLHEVVTTAKTIALLVNPNKPGYTGGRSRRRADSGEALWARNNRARMRRRERGRDSICVCGTTGCPCCLCRLGFVPAGPAPAYGRTRATP